MIPVVKRLNATNFNLLAWCANPLIVEKFGLENVTLVEQMDLNTWGKESHIVFFYAKNLPPENKAAERVENNNHDVDDLSQSAISTLSNINEKPAVVA